MTTQDQLAYRILLAALEIRSGVAISGAELGRAHFNRLVNTHISCTHVHDKHTVNATLILRFISQCYLVAMLRFLSSENILHLGLLKFAFTRHVQLAFMALWDNAKENTFAMKITLMKLRKSAYVVKVFCYLLVVPFYINLWFRILFQPFM